MEKDDRHPLRDMLWYIAIGVLVVIGIGAYVAWVPVNKSPGRKWPLFAYWTVMLFVFLSKFYWRYRRRLRLWSALFACLVVHLAVSVPLLSKVEQVPTLFYPALMPAEAVLIMLVLWRSLRISPDSNVKL